MLFVLLPETSALPGSRSGAGPASQPAAGVTQEGKSTAFIKAHSSGVGVVWPEGREENLGPGACPARCEMGRNQPVLHNLYSKTIYHYRINLDPVTDRFTISELLLYLQHLWNRVNVGVIGHFREASKWCHLVSV